MANDEPMYAAEANRLYWSNEASVGEIAEKLGISRRALYDLIDPRPSGAECPRCRTITVFANRSALVSGTARCPSCDLEIQIEAVTESSPQNEQADRGFPPWFSDHRVAVGGAALAGAAIGAIAALLITRRR